MKTHQSARHAMAPLAACMDQYHLLNSAFNLGVRRVRAWAAHVAVSYASALDWIPSRRGADEVIPPCPKDAMADISVLMSLWPDRSTLAPGITGAPPGPARNVIGSIDVANLVLQGRLLPGMPDYMREAVNLTHSRRCANLVLLRGGNGRWLNQVSGGNRSPGVVLRDSDRLYL